MSEGTSPRDPRERPPPPPQPPPGWGPPGPGSGQGWGPPPPQQGWGQQQNWGGQQGWGQQPPGWGQQPQDGSGGFSENVAGGLTYLVAFVILLLSGLISFPTRIILAMVPCGVGLALVLTDRRREVRFNALQGTLLWVIMVVAEIGRHTAASLWTLPIIVGSAAAEIALFVVLLGLMAAAFQGRHLKLPAIGDFAERQASGHGGGHSPRQGPGPGPQGWGDPR